MSKKKSKRRKTSNKRQAKAPASKKWPVNTIAAVIAAAAVGGFFFFSKSDPIPYANPPAKTSIDPESLKGGETRPTLSPALFVGNVARAYNIAGENRELLDSMYCYCNCKKTIGHKSLLSCYTDKHAVDCKICQDQAFYAVYRYQEGKDIAGVRSAVDKKFWRPLR